MALLVLYYLAPREGPDRVYRTRKLCVELDCGKGEMKRWWSLTILRATSLLCRSDKLSCLQENQLHWFPRLRTLSLAVEDKDSDQGEVQKIHKELLTTQQVVMKLSEQLADLRREVRTQLIPYF